MARSPNRDLIDRFAGNRRYFQRWTPVERSKIWLSRLAVLGVLGWAAATFLTDRFNYQTSHGPLAAVHAPWDATCEACHRPDADRKHIFDARSRWQTFTCEKCHSAPKHHSTVPPGDASENCATCHDDHKGRDHSLVRLGDHHCVRCHSNLAANTVGTPRFTNATNFATDHPPLPAFEDHQRSLKFSHSQHLTPGMVLAKDAKNAWRLGDVPAERRAEFAEHVQPGTDIILLNCNYCHTLETNPPTRAAGRYFQPINYERHCAACHPTLTQPVVTSRQAVVPEQLVPHGLQPDQLRRVVDQTYSLAMQKDHPELLKRPAMRDLRRQATPEVEAFAEEIASTSSKAFDALLNVGCAKCHDGLPEKVAPPNIPTIWLRNSRFDHTAHRAMDCLQCHPSAVSRVENGVTIVNEREPVNLPKLESCRDCHSPKGAVRHACTDCHNYHNNDHPLHGRGSPEFAPKTKLTIEEFLRGH